MGSSPTRGTERNVVKVTRKSKKAKNLQVGDQVYYTIGSTTYPGTIMAIDGNKHIIQGGDRLRNLPRRKLVKRMAS